MLKKKKLADILKMVNAEHYKPKRHIKLEMREGETKGDEGRWRKGRVGGGIYDQKHKLNFYVTAIM